MKSPDWTPSLIFYTMEGRKISTEPEEAVQRELQLSSGEQSGNSKKELRDDKEGVSRRTPKKSLEKYTENEL